MFDESTYQLLMISFTLMIIITVILAEMQKIGMI